MTCSINVNYDNGPLILDWYKERYDCLGNSFPLCIKLLNILFAEHFPPPPATVTTCKWNDCNQEILSNKFVSTYVVIVN